MTTSADRGGRLLRAAAWALVGITVTAVVLDTMITAAYQSLLSERTWAFHGWPLATLATLGSALMGALVVSRHPRHPIGWLLFVPALASLSLASEAYGIWVLDHDGPGPEVAGHVAAWASLLLGGQLALTALTLIFLISPDGRLSSPGWRWAGRASVAGLVFYSAGVLTIDPTTFEFSADQQVDTVTGLLGSAGFLLTGGALIASTVSLVRRLRRTRDEVRRQLLWIAASATFLALGFVWLVLVQVVSQEEEQSLLSAGPLFTAYLAFPVCAAVAVLRHRMLEIDLIVNRALMLAAAAFFAAAGYVLVVVLVGATLGGRPGGFWPSLLATALVALAFQPLRRWVVRVADRLAFGASAAPYEALADFSRRLGDSPDPRALLPAVADAAGTAVGARRATVRLTGTGGSGLVATWPAGQPPVTGWAVPAVPVLDRGEPLGSIAVDMPPGRALRPRETRLLRDLADQAAIAFRNARLTGELAERVAELDQRTTDLGASGRELVVAGDAEKARFAAALRRRVLPHLDALPDRLREHSAQVGSAGSVAVSLDLSVERGAAEAALDELRRLVRGSRPGSQRPPGQRAVADHRSPSRSGPNEDFVT